MSLMKGFNAIHGIAEDRNFIVRRSISSVQTLLFIIIIAALLIFVVFGNKLLGFTSRYFPYLAIIIEAVIDIKWLFFPVLLTLAFLLCLNLFQAGVCRCLHSFRVLLYHLSAGMASRSYMLYMLITTPILLCLAVLEHLSLRWYGFTHA